MIKRFEQFNESIDNQEFKEYFLSLINGCRITWHGSEIIWRKDNKKLLIYDKSDEIFEYSVRYIYSELSKFVGYNYSRKDINDLLTTILKDRFNCPVSKTITDQV